MSTKPLRMSPSRLADALACPGRVRGGTEVARGLSTSGSTSPSARVGLICHRAFELFFSSSEALDKAWKTAVAEQQEAPSRDCDPESLSNALQPELLRMQYLRLERAIHRVTDRLVPGDSPFPEKPLQSRDGQLVGTADLVVSGRSHWIADLKTGRISDPDGGARPEYVRQLMLYAYMEAEQS